MGPKIAGLMTVGSAVALRFWSQEQKSTNRSMQELTQHRIPPIYMKVRLVVEDICRSSSICGFQFSLCSQRGHAPLQRAVARRNGFGICEALPMVLCRSTVESKEGLSTVDLETMELRI
jgi:hypothetical protein